MKFVASRELGQLGLKEGSAVIYNWRWYYNTPGLLLWIIVAMAIVLIKGNHKPAAFLILIPVLIVSLLWTIFKKAMSFGPTEMILLDMLFNSFVAGITVLWLLGEKISNRYRFATFLFSFDCDGIGQHRWIYILGRLDFVAGNKYFLCSICDVIFDDAF